MSLIALFIFVACLLACDGIHAKRGGMKTRRVCQVDWVKPCDDLAQNAITCSSIKRNMDRRGEVAIDADCHINRGTTFWKRLEINLTKCNDVVSTNTCEYFQTWKFKTNVCSILNEPNTLWAAVVSSVDPPVRCPFKPGNYSCRNATLDVHRIERLPLPLDNTVYVTKVTLFDENMNAHLCVHGAVRFIRVRT